MGSLDRSLTLSFGAVVLALMALFLAVASALSFQIQDKRQEFLATTLAGAVGESVNRVNFYQMRDLVEELKDNLPGLGYVAVADLSGNILAHSRPELAGKTTAAIGLPKGDQGDLLWEGVHYLQKSLPLRGGLDQGVVGTIYVGVSVEDLHQDQTRYFWSLLILTLGGTLTAMAAVFYLSHRFGGQVQTLARQLQGILDRAPVGIAVFNSRGQVVLKSRSFSALTDDPDATFPGTLEPRMAPGAFAELSAQAAQVRAEGRDTSGEWALGAETWQLAQFPLGTNQTGLIAQDLTLRVLVEKELAANRNQLNQIIDKSPVGIAIVDSSSGRILRLNECFETLFGYRKDQVSTVEKWFEAVYPDEEIRLAVLKSWDDDVKAQRVDETPIAPVERPVRCADGSLKEIRIAKAVVGSMVVVTLVDRTDQKRAEKAIIDLNHSLEEKVRSRTEELEKTYRELVDTEKLAALGQLAAGMAHELNTPLGAIQAANRQNSDFLRLQLAKTIADVATLGTEEISFLLDLLARNQVLARKLSQTPDRRRRRQALGMLEVRGLEADEDLAEYLLELGFQDSDLDLLAQNPGRWEVLRRGREFLSLLRMTLVVAEGTEKASHVVNALRRYLKGSDEEEYALFAVSEQLETILTLFQHKIRTGVEVVRRFTPGIQVYGDRQRLNQVWMNLVHNALQSMEFRGTLTLTIAAAGPAVQVKVTDTGPGIPEGIKDRIFTPYFTTKKQGEGLGLGLDLCLKIIESHQGTIEFVSRPGDTTFTVTLPAPQEISQ